MKKKYSPKRQTATKVAGGLTLRKNRHAESPSIWNNATDELVFEKERPGPGFFHAISKADLVAFTGLIPDWNELAQGLKGVRLVQRDLGADGWYHHGGIICICAWERELWRTVSNGFFIEHRALFDRLNLSYERDGEEWLLKHNVETIRAYQLLHIFLHELGHHHDLMTTRSQKEPSRGEVFAEGWALEFERKIWERYQETFGVL